MHKEKQIKQNIFKKSKTAQRKEQESAAKSKDEIKKKPQKNKLKNEEKSFPEHKTRDVNPKDLHDMMRSDSSDEETVEVPAKRQRLDSVDSDSEMSQVSFETDEDSSDEETMKKMELQQRKDGARNAEESKKMKEMLPIKTKTGVVPRLVEDLRNSDDEEVDESDEEIEAPKGDDEDTDEELLKPKSNKKQEKMKKKGAVSAAELLMEREQELQKQKFRIGVICSGILEKPEEKVKNFQVLLDLMPEFTQENEPTMLSVRKLALISLAEVFKDINPDYKLGVVDLEQQKVKKDTLARVTYENELLKYYKNYLRNLEHITKALKPKKYEARPTREKIELAEIAVLCLCESLMTSPYFNFSTNIAQLLVTLLNCYNQNVRKKIHESFIKIFKTDKRLDLTLHIVRNINQLVKKKSNFVFVEVISCLIALQIKNINVNAEKEAELKQKKLEQHKSRLISMSKREKKRKKKLAELEKEMMETQAEENKQTKNSKLTDISKLVFTIYFRILKQNPNSRLLSATLEGLAK